jgi:hypothetical protein
MNKHLAVETIGPGGVAAGWARLSLRELVFSVSILCLGLFLRLAGLFFSGMHDVDQIVLQWGGNVVQYGIGQIPIKTYGVLSYFFHGLAFAGAEIMPRFWWAPHKCFEVLFEAGILYALLVMAPQRRKQILYLYWLNPLFILHGAWWGYWDGPYVFFGLMAPVCLRLVPRRSWAWILAGGTLTMSALFKPQGLIYFIVPMLICLALLFMLTRRSELWWCVFGGALVFLVTSLAFLLAGGDASSIPLSYFIGGIMANLCNTAINIWWAFSKGMMVILGQEGRVYQLELPYLIQRLLDFSALAVVIALIAWFSLRLALPADIARLLARWVKSACLKNPIRIAGAMVLLASMAGLFRHSAPENTSLIMGYYSPFYFATIITGICVGGGGLVVPSKIGETLKRAVVFFLGPIPEASPTVASGFCARAICLLILGFAALVIPQFGTRAHMNHTYAALVLLLPLGGGNRKFMMAWIGMCLIQLYGNLAVYQLGSCSALPVRNTAGYAEIAQQLLVNINPNQYPSLLQVQSAVSRFISHAFPIEPVLSILGITQFFCALYMVQMLFKWATAFPRPTSMRSDM